MIKTIFGRLEKTTCCGKLKPSKKPRHAWKNGRKLGKDGRMLALEQRLNQSCHGTTINRLIAFKNLKSRADVGLCPPLNYPTVSA
jgi:hypothetical protein